jgi:hypothetical protein
LGLDNKNSKKETALISKIQKELENIAKLLNSYKINFTYEKSGNVLNNQVVKWIKEIFRFIKFNKEHKIHNYFQNQVDILLHKILSHEYFVEPTFTFY